MLDNFKHLSETYLNSILNEIAVDKTLFVQLKVSDLIPTFIPRPVCFIDSLKGRPRIIRLTFPFFVYFFAPLILPFFIFYRFFHILIRYFIFAWNDQNIEHIPKHYVLCFSSKIFYLIKQIFKNDEMYFLEFPWVFKSNQNDNVNLHSAFYFLKPSDFFIAIVFSFCLIAVNFFRIGFCNISQTYVTFDWLLVYFSLRRLSPHQISYTYTNHYDRWAVLIDSISTNRCNNFIQHGSFPMRMKLPYLQKNIMNLYYLNTHSYFYFLDNIVSPNSLVDAFQISFKLNFCDSFHCPPNKNSVLIISEPQSLDFELKIAELLSAKYFVLIKPHPKYLYLYNSQIFKQFIFFRDSDLFPRTDCAVAGNSTLGLEYELSGIQVFWHDQKDVDSLLCKIDNFLEVRSKCVE